MDCGVLDRLLDAARSARRCVVDVDLRESVAAARAEYRDIGTDDGSAGALVSGPLVQTVALSAVGAGGWLFDPMFGPRIVNVMTGEERRVVANVPPGMIGGGVVTAVALSDGGSGYTTAPTVTISGGGGSGAVGEAVLAAGGIATIDVTSGGTGYRTVPGITIRGGGSNPRGTRFTVLLTPSSVTRIDITAGGSGYTQASTTATLTGGGGSGARIRRVEVTSGRVTHIVLDAVGSGYTSPPSVTITDSATSGPGTGATAVALLRATSVASVTVTAAGTGYTEIPEIEFTGGMGSGATATATLTARAVASINVLTGGGGYTTAPTVTISGGGGSGAAATATITTQRPSPEGTTQPETPGSFASTTLRFQTLRPIVSISRELLDDGEMIAAIVAESLGAAIAASIEQHLLLDATDGILSSENNPLGLNEGRFNANTELAAWNGMHQTLRNLGDFVRSDRRLRWMMGAQWADRIYATQFDGGRPFLTDEMDAPFNVPLMMAGHGPVYATTGRPRFGAVGVWPTAAIIALVGPAQIMIDPYGLGHQGEIRLSLVQRYAATKWNTSWFATISGQN